MATPAPTPTDTPYIKYAEGLTDSGASTYNFLVSGKGDYTNSSGLMIKGDTASAKGTRIAQDVNDNAFFDLRTTKGGVKNISMRLVDHDTGAAANMMVLTDDDKSSTSTFGASVTGRVKASQLHVGEADTRAPVASGVYMGHDASNLAYLKVNKGASGSGGFKFATHSADGTEAQVNLELLAEGYVKAVKYSASGNSLDTESTAIAAFDSTGQLVRSYQQNARFRSLEERLDSVESDTLSGTPLKVNEIIRRLNSLKFFSSDIPLLDAGSAPTPFVV
jgi:hypothetical protein